MARERIQPPPYLLIAVLCVLLVISGLNSLVDFGFLFFGKVHQAKVLSLTSSSVPMGTKSRVVKHVEYEYKGQDGKNHINREEVNTSWEVSAGDPTRIEWVRGDPKSVRLFGNGYKLPIATFWFCLVGLMVVGIELRWEVWASQHHRRRHRRLANLPQERSDVAQEE